MTHKLVAFGAAVACMLILCATVCEAQSAPQTLSQSVCGTGDLTDIIGVYNFDSPGYKSEAASIPAGVKSYLAELLTGRLNSCAALAGQSAAKSACKPAPREGDARALWEQLKFCVGILGFGPQAQPLVATNEPTFYVLLSIGAGPGGAPGGTSAAKSGGGAAGGGGGGGGGKGGGGPATGSTATGSSVDNPSYFLLFVIASRIEHDVCARSHIALQDCDSQHPVAIVPESTWNLEDFRTQCLDDPYVPNDANNPYGTGLTTPAGHGTIGAIVLNGSMVTADGTFAVVTVYGSSEANYTAQVVGCSAAGPPFLSTVWSDNISDGNKTTALSFYPLALAGTLLESNAAAHEAAAPAPNPSASPNVLNSFITYQNDVAFGIFAANSSGLTLGNPSSGLTFRHTFEGWASKLEANLNAFCKLHTMESVCKALKLPS